jgi:hypothetical protein
MAREKRRVIHKLGEAKKLLQRRWDCPALYRQKTIVFPEAVDAPTTAATAGPSGSRCQVSHASGPLLAVLRVAIPSSFAPEIIVASCYLLGPYHGPFFPCPMGACSPLNTFLGENLFHNCPLELPNAPFDL